MFSTISPTELRFLRPWKTIGLAMVFLAGGIAAASAPHAANRDVGVVFMHGKNGTPYLRAFRAVARSISDAGYQVVTPEMPWSRDRFISTTVSGALSEIARHVNGLRRKGARKIVLGGHSLGASMALAYAARRPGVSGVFMLAAGHLVEGRVYQGVVGGDVARARALIRAGKGNQRSRFMDLNTGGKSRRLLTASIYYDWYNPRGPASMRLNARRLPGRVQVLWIIGSTDRVSRAAEGIGIYRAIPGSRRKTRHVASGGHRDMLWPSREIVRRWLAQFSK